MTNLEYASYISDIMEMSNNGVDLIPSHLEIVEIVKEKMDNCSHSEHHMLKNIHAALDSGFYNKADFEE
jgi:hypothetical protein